MSERELFLAAIIENPADDALRLIFADWLDERGECERAEFIRIQCELAMREAYAGTGKREQNWSVELKNYMSLLRRREHDLLQRQNLPEWQCSQREWSWLPHAVKILENRRQGHGGLFWQWSRGFVSYLTLTCADWLTHRDSLLQALPMERVMLRQLPQEAGYYPDPTVSLRRWLMHEAGYCPDPAVLLRRGDHMLIRLRDTRILDLSFCVKADSCGVAHDFPVTAIPGVLLAPPFASPI